MDKPEHENNRFYIFHKKFYKEEQIRHFEHGVEKTLSQIGTYYTPSFITNLPNYNVTNNDDSEVKMIAERINETLEYTKEQFRKLKVSIKLGEKLKDNLNNQLKATSILVNNLTNYIEITKNNYSKLKENLESVVSTDESILANYPSSIAYLKTNEVHQSLQTEKIKYLIDIYFAEDKMDSWKTRCIKSQKYLKDKIYSKQDIILGAFNKLNKEKTASIETMKTENVDRHAQFDSFINNKETRFIKLITNINDDAKTLKKLIEEGEINKTSKDYTDLHSNYINLGLVKEKQKIASSYVVEMDEELAKMKEQILKNMLIISVLFSNFYMVKKELGDLLNSFIKYEKEIKKCEEDFDYLSNPSMFPEAYKQSLIEVRRRLLFNKEMMSISERMHEILHKENESRKKFIDYYGKYLTNDYIPSLKFVSLKLNIDFYNNKEVSELPSVQTEEDEEEFIKFNSFLSNLEVKISSLNKIEDLNSSSMTSQKMLNADDLKDKFTNINNNNVSNATNSNQNQDFNMKSFEEVLRIQKIKTSELEQKLLFKEQELKRLHEKINEKDKKLNEMSVETDRFLNEVDKINSNYLKQISIKDAKLNEKAKEIENLLKSESLGSKNCIMCIDQAKNSLEYESWNTYVYSLNDNLMKNNILLKEIENSNKDLACRLSFVKKQHFQYLMNMTNLKNIEMKKITDECDLKMLELEDHFKKQKEKYEEEFKLKTTYIEKSVSEINKEVVKLRKENEIKTHYNERVQMELTDKNKKLLSLENEMKSLVQKNNELVQEIENFKHNNEKLNEENNLFSPLKNQLESEIQSLKEENLAIKRQNNKTCADLQSEIIKYSELAEENERKLKEKEGDYDKLKLENSELEDTVEKFRILKNTELSSLKSLNSQLEKEIIELKKKNEELEHSLTTANNELKNVFSVTTSNNTNSNTQSQNKAIMNNFSKKHPNIFEVSEIVKDTHDCFFSDNSTTKLGSTDNNCLTNINLTNLTRLTDLEEFVNIKKLEKGNRAIFIPFCEGIYVPICLSNSNSDEESKLYHCGFVLNINNLDKNIQEVMK